MKLAFLIFKYYPYGGLQRDCIRFAKFCAQQGHQVEIMTMEWQGSSPPNLKVRIIAKRGLSNHVRANNFAKDVKPLLSQFDKVIGFDRMPDLDFYFAGDLCFAATSKQKHRFWFQFTRRYRGFCQLEQQVFQPESKTKIFVLTEYVKQTYQNYYHTSSDRFILIPPGVNQQNISFSQVETQKIQYKKQLGLQGKFNLLQVGSDFKRKGVDRSIRSIAALPEALKNQTHLYIVGRGNRSYYESLAKKLGVSEHIHFVGTTDNIGHFMLAADLLLHTAYFETAGMVLIEALTFGLPIIVTEKCGYAFHVADANAGIIIKDPFEQEKLNKSLAEILSNSNLKSMSQNALTYAKHTDLYSMDQHCLQAIEYNQLQLNLPGTTCINHS